MKKKNGFTLVELLAVIVVLAIIMIIAIPAVLEAMSRSRKDSFYLYAQKLYSESISKYTRDMDENPENLTCAVYDIKTDLGLSDTGNFDGWVRVSRKAASSGKNNVTIKLNESKELQTIRFCVGKGNTCSPNESFYVPDGTKSATITKAVKEGQVLCVSYQVPNDKGVLVSRDKQCVAYDKGVPYIDTYEYEVNLALTNKSYSVENAIMSEELSKDDFFKLVDDFNASHSSLAISKPSCNGESEVKGTTTVGLTNVTGPTESTRSTQTVTGPQVTTRNTENVTGPTNSSQGSTNVTAPTNSSQGSTNVTGPTESTRETSNPNSTMISNDRSTSFVDKTTAPVGEITDATMLQNLTVQGYDIEFNPGIYYYELTVPNNITSLNVSATPKVVASQINITGQDNFAVGENLILVEVYDQSTNKRAYYRLFVTRFNEKGEKPTTSSTKGSGQTTWDPSSGKPDPTLDDSNASLKSLKVSGYQLEFNPEVYEYTLTTRGESEIYITATAEKKGARVLVTGNKDVKDGSEIKIKVTSKNNYYDKTYIIKIKTPKEENTTTKTFRLVAIGLIALLAIVATVMGLTRKNRRKNYDGEAYSTSGPGVNGQGGKTFEEQQQALAQTGMVPNPTPVANQNPLPATPTAAPQAVPAQSVPGQNPGSVLPQTPVAQEGQNQGGNQIPPQQ